MFLILAILLLWFIYRKAKSWGEDQAYMRSIDEPHAKQKSVGESAGERMAVGNSSNWNRNR